MKMVFASLFLATALSGQLIASTDVHSVIIQNGETSEAFNLNTIVMRTEYRYEDVQSTCYDRVFDGYRTVCDNFMGVNQLNKNMSVNEVGPHPAPGPHPRDPRDPPPETKPGPSYPRDPDPTPYPSPYPDYPRERRCYQEAVYRDVVYSCIKRISIPYEVFDHNASANVNVKISSPPASKPQSRYCGIDFILNGDILSAKNTCPEYIATAQVNKNGSGYSTNYSYAINLFDSEKVLAPLAGGLSKMRVEGNTLIARVGNISEAKNFSLKLFVQRKRILKSDIVMINRKLTQSEFTYQAVDERTGLVKINLSKLVGSLSERKYTVRLSLDVTLPSGTIIDGQNLPNLHQEESVTIKN